MLEACAGPVTGATTVVHVRKAPFDVYIGRATAEFAASRFANPFRIGAHGSRTMVLTRYRRFLSELLEQDPLARQELQALRGKRLGCWCKPDDCHGDILVLALEGRLDDEPPTPPLQGCLF